MKSNPNSLIARPNLNLFITNSMKPLNRGRRGRIGRVLQRVC